jgi:hypothetical protein
MDTPPRRSQKSNKKSIKLPTESDEDEMYELSPGRREPPSHNSPAKNRSGPYLKNFVDKIARTLTPKRRRDSPLKMKSQQPSALQSPRNKKSYKSRPPSPTATNLDLTVNSEQNLGEYALLQIFKANNRRIQLKICVDIEDQTAVFANNISDHTKIIQALKMKTWVNCGMVESDGVADEDIIPIDLCFIFDDTVQERIP